jgi:hypothetical protein
MFTLFDFVELLGWLILRLLLPLGILFGLWVFFQRISVRRFKLAMSFFCCILFCAAFVGWFVKLAGPIVWYWPPHWLERVRQRKEVYERAQNAGGWDLLKTEANALAESNAATGFMWIKGHLPDENPELPKSFKALNPKRVDLWRERNGICAVRVSIFGANSTGGRGQDFYSIKIICPNAPHWPNAHSDAPIQYDRKIADDIYEVTSRN